MKKYELIIQDKDKTLVYKGGCGSAIKGLNIEFSIPHYDDATHVNLPTTITITNADLDLYFKNLAKTNRLKDAALLLYAGWDNSGVFDRTGIAGFNKTVARVGNFSKVKTTYQRTDPIYFYGLIYMGKISAYVPNYSSLTEPSILLACTPLTTTNTKIGKHLSITGALNPLEITKWIKNFTNASTTVICEPSVKGVKVKNPCILSAHNLNQALDALRRLGIASTRNKINQLVLFKAKSAMVEPTKAEEYMGVNAYKVKTKPTKAKEIYATQIIGIPRQENTITLQLVIALNYIFKVGDLVYLDTKSIYKFALQNNNFAAIISLVEVQGLQGGDFSVVGVEHTGDFRSQEPTKWATILTMARLGDHV